MARSLQRIFRLQDSSIGLACTSAGGGQKLVKSPETGARAVVPGHVSEVVFQSDRKVTEPDISRLCGDNWNWERNYIRVIRKKDRVVPAIPTHDEYTGREVREK